MRFESIIRPPESKIIKSGRVILKPGEEIGKHTTTNREEIIVVLRGVASIIISNSPHIVNSGETFFVPINTLHNVINNSDHNLEYIYIVGLINNPATPDNQESS